MLNIRLTEKELRIVINALESYYYDVSDMDSHPLKSDLRVVLFVLNRLKKRFTYYRKDKDCKHG